MDKIESMNILNLKNKIRIFLFSFLCLLIVQNVSYAQLLSGKEEKKLSKDHIISLHEGSLIVPLFRQSSKINTLEKMIIDEEADEDTKRKLSQILEEEKNRQNEFNLILVSKFQTKYTFSRVLFIYDDDLKNFDSAKASYLDPESLEYDRSIRLGGADHYFLKYRKASGVATSPIDVRFFIIADKNMQIIERPFPGSPGRKSSFSLRVKDLLNISPNTNELLDLLVTKLNANLERYYSR